MCKLQPIMSRSQELLSPAFQDSGTLHAYFSKISEVELELDTWRTRQVNEWQPQTLIGPAPGGICSGELDLWPGHIETYYDCKLVVT